MALRGLGFCVTFVLRHVNSPRLDVFCSAVKFNSITCRIEARRYLLSEDVVRLEDFQKKKLAVARQLSGSKGHFFAALNEKIETNQLLLKDELKLLLLLCQSPEDMVMARNAIYRYHEQNGNMVFGEFRFGPLFMRLCYELGLADLAFTTLTDKRLKGFFPDCTSFNLAIDLLFSKGQFEGVLELIREMKAQGVVFNKDTFTLAFATCYKLNTAKSYQICLALLEEGQTKVSFIPRHAYCIAVAFALKQDDVERAQSIYTQIMNTDSRLCQNLRVLLLAMAGSINDAVSVLTTALLSDSLVFVKKPDFCQEVVDVLKERSENGPWKIQVDHLIIQLQKAGQVNPERLDHLLYRTPTGKRKLFSFLHEGTSRTSSRRTLRPLLLE
ncbi:pentatricopeptide repeat-containing protein 2, mitochondrial isoform X1 [Tachysurus fulvidraco]|uniref:pentatricopeptide repeat-containing protein 2, mitochondrial isoform X1 n=1 Tax=Tachysurus fulvidraco TaxID=1234273 RepID=UPI001FF02FB0|nr:pentatricopeptide repeat-containing protein 2, mitochondrial isoform X1 [Tachysurus fulvidraco]